MFDLKNNNISTILLLGFLGLLIWYLTKPKKNENFTNQSESQPLNETPIKQQSNNIQINQPSQNELRITQPLNDTHIIQPLNIQQPLIESTNVQTPELSINNFQGYDGASDSNGADINAAFQPPVPTANTSISAVDINKQSIQNYNAKDFLPKEINNQWFDTDFSQAKTNIEDDKLINTERYVIGINTVGQSLKNASYDIRGTIANPKFSVSPWNNSTYEPDYNIKPLC